MKKIICLILAMVLVLGTSGCAAKLSDEELMAQGWVKNPAENGWVNKPADNGWVFYDKADVVTGTSEKIDPATQLTQEQIKALALEYLRGWELTKDEKGATVWSYREMYQIATSHNNKPGLSSVEFFIDPKTMKLYGSCEKGTEKCEHIKTNPSVTLYWCKQIDEKDYVAGKNDYFNSYGVQIKGTARLMSLDEPNSKDIASAYMRTMRGAKAWDATPEDAKTALITKLFQYNDWIEVSPDEYVVNSLLWSYNKEKSARPEFYDPKSPYFGKAVRQVYYVK